MTSRSITAFGAFLMFGAAMALFAAILLLWPGTILDKAWVLNPTAQRALTPLSRPAAILFLGFSAVLAFTAVGWFRRRTWAWLLALLIMLTQALGDIVNAAMGQLFKGAIGIVIAGALLVFLLRPKVRAHFLTERETRAPHNGSK